MSTSATYPKPFTLAEVADILRVDYHVIYREVRKKRLVAQKVGKEYQVHVEALDRYLLEPWQNPADDPKDRTSGCAKTMSGGSSSTMENRFPPGYAVGAARKLLNSR
ncbi:helix-turn-helix domain-containing protein [Roseovarius bejariae]